jgi:hypothetical protein
MVASAPIVFVHLGQTLPSYMRDTVRQARRWNPHSEIVCIAETPEPFEADETWIRISDIPPTEAYERFKATTVLDSTFRGGFWRFTTERLFVLQSWMTWRGIRECFHLENDNPMYFSLGEILPQLQKTSPGLLAPIHGQGQDVNSFRVCLSAFYVSSLDALSNLVFTLASAPSGIDEMERCGEYWLLNRDECGFLPTAPPRVVLRQDDYRDSLIGGVEEFGFVFDAMLYGQHLGGVDPRNELPGGGPGFVNLDAEFAADQFLYGWRADGAGRRYPVLTDHDGREWRLANLHIHCKRVADFCS